MLPVIKDSVSPSLSSSPEMHPAGVCPGITWLSLGSPAGTEAAAVLLLLLRTIKRPSSQAQEPPLLPAAMTWASVLAYK